MQTTPFIQWTIFIIHTLQIWASVDEVVLKRTNHVTVFSGKLVPQNDVPKRKRICEKTD